MLFLFHVVLLFPISNTILVSYGCCGDHFIAKNSQHQIFAAGKNDYGQLGTGHTQSVSIPKEINSQYSNIWGDLVHNSRAKSARK